MPRVKVPRKSTAIDMTAMCDVAFLLLTFFILSAKQKTQDPVRAEVPAASVEVALPENDFATIIIGEGKVFYGIEGADLRMETLKKMAEKHQMTFTPQEIVAFGNTESFGIPLGNMHQFLALTNTERAALKTNGIPVDTFATNELFDWVHATREVDKALHNKELRIAIKGDAKEEYPTVAMVIKTLQKQKVNKFSLITTLKTAKK